MISAFIITELLKELILNPISSTLQTLIISTLLLFVLAPPPLVLTLVTTNTTTTLPVSLLLSELVDDPLSLYS